SVPFTLLYHNNTDGTFTKVNAGLTGVRGGSASWGDYDQDGKLDLLLAGNSSGSSNTPIAKIYHGNGAGGFTDINAGLAGAFYGSAMWVDYNNDGTLGAFVEG